MAYKYKEYVSNIKIKGNDTHRYLLSYTLTKGEKEKSALVIMQNPSKATTEISDQTINRVLETLHNFKYKKVYIANLIPIYATNSAKISDIVTTYPAIYNYNDLEIKDKINKVSKIFVAWGGKNKFEKNFYNCRIDALKQLLKGKTPYCYKINSDGTPIHPSRNQWKTGINEDDFVPYTF